MQRQPVTPLDFCLNDISEPLPHFNPRTPYSPLKYPPRSQCPWTYTSAALLSSSCKALMSARTRLKSLLLSATCLLQSLAANDYSPRGFNNHPSKCSDKLDRSDSYRLAETAKIGIRPSTLSGSMSSGIGFVDSSFRISFAAVRPSMIGILLYQLIYPSKSMRKLTEYPLVQHRHPNPPSEQSPPLVHYSPV